jgi:hypothetical protein
MDITSPDETLAVRDIDLHFRDGATLPVTLFPGDKMSKSKDKKTLTVTYIARDFPVHRFGETLTVSLDTLLYQVERNRTVTYKRKAKAPDVV